MTRHFLAEMPNDREHPEHRAKRERLPRVQRQLDRDYQKKWQDPQIFRSYFDSLKNDLLGIAYNPDEHQPYGPVVNRYNNIAQTLQQEWPLMWDEYSERIGMPEDHQGRDLLDAAKSGDLDYRTIERLTDTRRWERFWDYKD